VPSGAGGAQPGNVGSQRLLALAARGARHDRALWTATVSAGGGATTSLVGSPETVAAALLDYVDIGVEIFQLRGYDYLADIIDFGEQLIPLVRQELARRHHHETPAHLPAATPNPRNLQSRPLSTITKEHA